MICKNYARSDSIFLDDAAKISMIQCPVPCCFVFFKELVQYVRCPTQRKEFKMSAFWSCMLKEFTVSEPEAKFLVILRTCTVFHLRSCHLRLIWGRASLRIYIIGTERRAQVRPPCSICEQYEPCTEPQLNLRWTWAWCAEIIWSSSLCLSLFSRPGFFPLVGRPLVKYGVRSPKFIWAPVYSCAHWLQLPPSARIWAHIQGRYWSAKIYDNSL